MGLALCARAEEAAVAPPPVPHTLVYADGDRVRGRIISRDDDTIDFMSVRFGLLHVKASEVKIEGLTELPVEPAKPKEAPAPEPEVPTDSIELLTYYMHEVFGQWHGKFSFSTEIRNDTSDSTALMIEATAKRKWEKDEVELNSRYEYNETNSVDNTDKFQGYGLWRHQLKKPFFAVYRPYYEWNREATLGTVSTDYIFLQQEVGVGITVLEGKRGMARVGIAENFFNNWDLTSDSETTSRIESVFVEAELKLPWRITLTERAVYYYSIADQNDGWEHQFEAGKKLTDTLSLGLRHEARYNDPDLRTENYSLVKFLVGFDF